MTDRREFLQFDGTGRNFLEARIVALVRVLDAAEELVAADDACNGVVNRFDELEVVPLEERYERAWDQLRSVLKSV